MLDSEASCSSVEEIPAVAEEATVEALEERRSDSLTKLVIVPETVGMGITYGARGEGAL